VVGIGREGGQAGGYLEAIRGMGGNERQSIAISGNQWQSVPCECDMGLGAFHDMIRLALH